MLEPNALDLFVHMGLGSSCQTCNFLKQSWEETSWLSEQKALPTMVAFFPSRPRYKVTVLVPATMPSGPSPTCAIVSIWSIVGRTWVTGSEAEGPKVLEVHACSWECDRSPGRMKVNLPPLSKWQMWFPWAKAWAMSHEGACQFEWMLFAWMMALNDSNASVAKRITGPKWQMWSGRWIRMWNFSVLNYCIVQQAEQSRKYWISCSRSFCLMKSN